MKVDEHNLILILVHNSGYYMHLISTKWSNNFICESQKNSCPVRILTISVNLITEVTKRKKIDNEKNFLVLNKHYRYI